MKEQVMTACEGKKWDIRCPTMTIIQVLVSFESQENVLC